MKTTRALYSLLIAAALAAVPARIARAEESSSQIAFSDPSKPGTLKIRVWHGEVTVHGDDVKEITVKSDSQDASPTPRKDGMRVLSASAGFVLSEKDNVASLEYGADGWTGGSADFDITVPRSTSIIVANSARGNLSCSDISGDIDVRTMSGDVSLDDISGGALVETMNGEISVNVKSLTASRPLSFSSMHGEISIHLPKDSKANIRFRTHRGVILTNFDDKSLVTRTVVTNRSSASGKTKDGKDMAPVEAVAPVAPAASSSADSATASTSSSKSDSDSDGDWHAEVRDSVREATREAADAAREAVDAMHEGLMEMHVELGGLTPPLPPMTGGKVVSGTLNGGGVQIQAATLNGDIVLKKSE
jgi:hypothetical protein